MRTISIKSIFIMIILMISTPLNAKQHKVHTKPQHKLSGVASWYSYQKSNRSHKTASGEMFSPNKHTAAHKTLPFGTKVKVTNLKNNKSVNVVINDRGPFIKGRVIDLSRAAAKAIDLMGTGTSNVSIKVIS